MAEKKVNVGVSESKHQTLTKIVDRENKKAGTKLYSLRTFLDVLIGWAENVDFNNKNSNQ